MIKKYWPAVAIALVVLISFLLGADCFRVFRGTFYFVFQARDIERARLLLEGNAIFFGPEMTGGGNLPGPLYYYLLAPAVYFGGKTGAWAMMLLLIGGASVAAWFWLRARLSGAAAWFWVGIFSTSYFLRNFIELFLNISYMLPFAILSLLCICEAGIAPTERRRNISFSLACLFIGLGIQLHFSLIFFLFAFIYLRPVRGRAMLAGLLFVLLPLLPYLGWLVLRYAGTELGQPAGMSGKAREALPTMLLYVKTLLQLPAPSVLWNAAHFVEVLPVPLLALALALWGRKRELTEPTPAQITLKRTLLVCAAFGLIPFAYFFVAPIGRRYLIPLGLPILFLATLAFERCRQNVGSLKAYCVAAAVLVVAGGLLAAKESTYVFPVFFFLVNVPLVAALFGIGSYFSAASPRNIALLTGLAVFLSAGLTQIQRVLLKEGYTSTSRVSSTRYVAMNRELTAAWEIIRDRTCWSYEEAVNRTYFVNHHLEQDPSFAWDQMPAPEISCTPAGKDGPDGFIVSILKRDSAGLREWLLASHIHPDLKRGIITGGIKVEDKSRLGTFLVVGYKVIDKLAFPPYFHNTGEGYHARSEYAVPAGSGLAAEAFRLPDSSMVFRWNECPGMPAFCDTGAVVKLDKREKGSWEARVRVLGSAISQSSPWISPHWTESWRKPYLRVVCDGKPEQAELADSIGYEPAYGESAGFPFDYNNSFLTPFDRTLRFRCAGKISSVTLGREETHVESLKQSFAIPGRSLTLNLSEIYQY